MGYFILTEVELERLLIRQLPSSLIIDGEFIQLVINANEISLVINTPYFHSMINLVTNYKVEHNKYYLSKLKLIDNDSLDSIRSWLLHAYNCLREYEKTIRSDNIIKNAITIIEHSLG